MNQLGLLLKLTLSIFVNFGPPELVFGVNPVLAQGYLFKECVTPYLITHITSTLSDRLSNKDGLSSYIWGKSSTYTTPLFQRVRNSLFHNT